jgi:hypothetical protein
MKVRPVTALLVFLLRAPAFAGQFDTGAVLGGRSKIDRRSSRIATTSVYHSNTVQSWYASVQREIGRGLLVDVA